METVNYGRNKFYDTGPKPCSQVLDRVARTDSGKLSRLLQCSNTYFGKKFYSTGPWAQCYKTVSGRILLLFVMKWSACPWQDFPA
jgi:hypothetical protein